MDDIEQNVKIHDSYQFEVKTSYPFSSKKKMLYEIESYFFLPTVLDVTPRNFSTDDFYKQSKSYFRLKTPSYKLHELLKEEEDSPFSKLKNSIKEQSNVSFYIKIFCDIIRSAFRDYINELSKNTSNQNEKTIINCIETAHDLLSSYRSLKSLVLEGRLENVEYFNYGDEYISLCLEAYSFRLLNTLKFGNFNLEASIKEKILNFCLGEQKHRFKSGYSSTPGNTEHNATTVFRKSRLKSWAQDPLFLKKRFRHYGKWVSHLISALSAGLAMAFALWVGFYSETHFKSYSFPFALTAITGYIFKDRIKDVIKTLWKKRLGKKGFDFKVILSNNENDKVGFQKEAFRFIESNDLPQKINQLAKRFPLFLADSLDNHLDILYYLKKIKIASKKLDKNLCSYEAKAFNQFFLFNVIPFLDKSDDPQKELYSFGESGFYKVYGEKFHIIDYVSSVKSGSKAKYFYYRLRVNRNGIDKVDKLFETF